MKIRCLVNSIWIPILSIWKENKLFSNHTAREVTNVLMHTSSKKVYQEDCNWCFKKFFCVLNWNVKGVIRLQNFFLCKSDAIWRPITLDVTLSGWKSWKRFPWNIQDYIFHNWRSVKTTGIFINSFDMKGCILQFQLK